MDVTTSATNCFAIYELSKRAMDIVLCSIALILLSPILAIVSLLIKFDSPGPVFFLQQRVGKHQKLFSMLKFRTMVVNAEDKQEELLDYNERQGPTFKMDNDPRVTRVGHYLRKHSIDELPQLINILKGEMTIVGPRPPVAAEVEKYKSWHLKRFSVKPGLTCFWQVSKNRNMSFDQWVASDLAYIRCRSISLDIYLISKTIPVVLFGQH